MKHCHIYHNHPDQDELKLLIIFKFHSTNWCSSCQSELWVAAKSQTGRIVFSWIKQDYWIPSCEKTENQRGTFPGVKKWNLPLFFSFFLCLLVHIRYSPEMRTLNRHSASVSVQNALACNVWQTGHTELMLVHVGVMKFYYTQMLHKCYIICKRHSSYHCHLSASRSQVQICHGTFLSEVSMFFTCMCGFSLRAPIYPTTKNIHPWLFFSQGPWPYH